MIVLVALIFIIGGYVVYMAHKENQNADRHRNRKQTHRNTYSSNRHTSGQHGGSDQKRKSAAQNASMRMTSHRMQDVGSEAGRIRQQLKLQRVNVNTRALASAEDCETRPDVPGRRLPCVGRLGRRDSRGVRRTGLWRGLP